jgi:hypothetical protein
MACLPFLNLSRFRAAPIARLSPLSFESDGAFPALCYVGDVGYNKSLMY